MSRINQNQAFVNTNFKHSNHIDQTIPTSSKQHLFTTIQCKQFLYIFIHTHTIHENQKKEIWQTYLLQMKKKKTININYTQKI